jgi:hypothetical protein
VASATKETIKGDKVVEKEPTSITSVMGSTQAEKGSMLKE